MRKAEIIRDARAAVFAAIFRSYDAIEVILRADADARKQGSVDSTAYYARLNELLDPLVPHQSPTLPPAHGHAGRKTLVLPLPLLVDDLVLLFHDVPGGVNRIAESLGSQGTSWFRSGNRSIEQNLVVELVSS
jgi:hypothetical protein